MISPDRPAGGISHNKTIDFVTGKFDLNLIPYNPDLLEFWSQKVILGFWVWTIGIGLQDEKRSIGGHFLVGRGRNVRWVWKSSSCILSMCFPKIHLAIHRHNYACSSVWSVVFICIVRESKSRKIRNLRKGRFLSCENASWKWDRFWNKKVYLGSSRKI